MGGRAKNLPTVDENGKSLTIPGLANELHRLEKQYAQV